MHCIRREKVQEENLRSPFRNIFNKQVSSDISEHNFRLIPI